MVKLKKKVRENVIQKFKNLLNKFPDDEVVKLMCNGIENRRVSFSNTVFFIHLLHQYNFDNMNDIDLIILCGKFDYVTPCGMSEFSPEQTLVINELNDAIFEMKHSEDGKC